MARSAASASTWRTRRPNFAVARRNAGSGFDLRLAGEIGGFEFPGAFLIRRFTSLFGRTISLHGRLGNFL